MRIQEHKRQEAIGFMLAHIAPAGDVELSGHLVQDAGPDASLYLPASHTVHVPPLLPVYPALHAQLLAA